MICRNRNPHPGHFLLAILFFLLGAEYSAAQITPAVTPTSSTLNAAARAAEPLFWSDGITQADQLPDYVRAGFNTVVVRLFWQPTEDGSIVADDLEPQRAFALAAVSLRLKIIYALPSAPFGQESDFRMNAQTGPYRVIWMNWVQRAIKELGDTPNLVGWMLPDDPRGLPFTNETSFSRWLGANYGDVQVLNRQWQTSFASLDEVSLAATRRLVERWRGPGTLPGAPSVSQIRDFIAQANSRPASQNFAFHPAGLAIAHYEWDAYRSLLDFWARAVRSADPRRQVISGRLPDYAQLLSVPGSIDIVVPSLSPAFAEPDLASHNPQAVDIARRAGRFKAVPVLSTGIAGLEPEAIARLAASWADAALAHGASGLVFDSWFDIMQNRPLRRAVTATLQRLQSAEYSPLWGQSPVSTTAIVLTPLAEGMTLKLNPAPTDALPGTQGSTRELSRGLYGFGDELVGGEPIALVNAMRWGTVFGSIDYLSPDDLGESFSLSRGGVLKRYGTVFLPQALSVPPAMAQELANYVSGGGVVVADLGLGATQNGGHTVGLPPEMAAMFGIIPTQMQYFAFNLQPSQVHPLLPTWSTQIAARVPALTGGSGPQGTAFAGPITFNELLPGTVPIALAFQMPQRLPGRDGNDPRDDITRIRRSWLTLRPFGQGFALFAPFRLWTLWRPGQPGFDGFHGDLMARGATLSHLGLPTLTSTPADTPEGVVQFVEAVNFPNAIALINHNATPHVPYGISLGRGIAPSTPAPIIIYEGDPENAEPLSPFFDIPQPSVRSTPSVAPGLMMNAPPNMEVAPEIGASDEANQAVIVHTSGVEYFLWSDALCVFPPAAVLAPTPGRQVPVAGAEDDLTVGSIVRPPVAHPLILHAHVPAMEMKVLRPLPLRVQNMQGGSLAARVAEYDANHIALRVWPNSESALPSGSSWRVAMGREGKVRFVIYDDENGYRLPPNSRHIVAVTENAGGARNNVRTTTNYTILADEEGRLNFELTGTMMGVVITSANAARPQPPGILPQAAPTTDEPAIVPATSSASPEEPAIAPTEPASVRLPRGPFSP